MLDLILCADWEFRYYSFNCAWAPGEMMGSMRNGSGNAYFIWFGSVGTAIKGSVREAPMDPYLRGREVYPGVLTDVPADFHKGVLEEPAFTIEDTTFLIWRLTTDSSWHCGKIQWPTLTRTYWETFLDGGKDYDGSQCLLGLLDGDPQKYKAWAEEYFEPAESGVDLTAEDIEHVLLGTPLSPELLLRMGCDRQISEMSDQIAKIGYGC